jgi:hypothetical protein
MYGSDDRIIFTSDRPRNGKRHLYPQLDEYETAPTNTGRHELHDYFNRSLKDDNNLREFNPPATRTNKNSIENFLQIKDDPARFAPAPPATA